MNYTITYSDNLPDGVGGRCVFPTFSLFGLGTCKIVIRPKYKEDIGIHNHEICHATQYKKDWLHTLKYNLSQNYRLECELEAYTSQVKAYSYTNVGQAMWIVEALMNKYDLDYSRYYLIERVKGLL